MPKLEFDKFSCKLEVLLTSITINPFPSQSNEVKEHILKLTPNGVSHSRHRHINMYVHVLCCTLMKTFDPEMGGDGVIQLSGTLYKTLFRSLNGYPFHIMFNNFAVM